MKTLFTSLSLFAIMIFIFSTCGEDNVIETSELEGRWEITEGSRNGEITTTMEGMYFIFAPDGQLQTNMMGAEETFAYELAGDELSQREGSIDADYKIESYEAGQMILTTELRNKQFRMVLEKDE
jgi:hypothetical protein